MKSSKLPIIIFVLLGLSIIAFQYTQNAKLKKELKAQNSKEIGSSGEGSLTLAGTGKGVSSHDYCITDPNALKDFGVSAHTKGKLKLCQGDCLPSCF